MERRSITFEGRVQGVFFRATAVDAARPFAVTGWVRNHPDGSVRMEIQGDPDQIDSALERLRAAKGRHIERERSHDLPLAEGETEFRIER